MEEVADELVKKINKGVDELTVGMPEVRTHIHTYIRTDLSMSYTSGTCAAVCHSE